MTQARRGLRSLVMVLGLIGATAALGAPGPGVILPWDEFGGDPAIGRPVYAARTMSLAGLQSGADHIVGQQCPNGGFGWPHNDCSATYNNVTGPICLGLLDAYARTADVDHQNAAANGGNYDLTSQYGNGEARFGAFMAHFLWRLSAATGNPAYALHAETEFFDELDASTYGPSDLNTAGWIGLVQAARAGTWVNLLPWEFHNIIPTAAAIGNAGQAAAFEQAVLDGLNTLNSTDPANIYSDLIGWAGGVRGLAFANRTSFPAINSPNHAGINGISTLEGLTNALVAEQNTNGSWYWHSNLASPTATDEDTQTTAYAVLALMQAKPLVSTDHSAAINKGRAWLLSMQLPSGGFLGYPSGDENTEVEGEALSALAPAGGMIPASSVLGLAALALLGVGVGAVVFRRTR